MRSSVLRGQGDRPLLTYIGGLTLAAGAAVGTLFIVLMALEAATAAQPPGLSVFGLDGVTVLQLTAALPLLLVLIGSQAALAYGLLRERTWARPLGAFIWLGAAIVTGGAQLVAGMPLEGILRALTWGVGMSGVAYWYLYRKRSVRAYYQRLG